MAALAGGRVTNPRTGGAFRWRPAGPVADEYAAIKVLVKRGYVCLGVIGNGAHLGASGAGDHTPYSTHCTVVDGKTRCPLRGWVYAIDIKVPKKHAAAFERWLLGRVRKGYYKWIKYFNINHRHWNQKARRAGKPFAWSVRSGDDHFHMSVDPGAEYAHSTILRDFDHYITTGKNPVVPAKPRPKPTRAHLLVATYPTLRQGHKSHLVGVLQAALYAAGQVLRIDDDFGPIAASKVKAFQRGAGLPASGVVDGKTWDKLISDDLGTVIRGSRGARVELMQALLFAQGFRSGTTERLTIDGQAGEHTLAQLKRFQVARKVKGSVTKGRGDGIGGTETWLALLAIKVGR